MDFKDFNDLLEGNIPNPRGKPVTQGSTLVMGDVKNEKGEDPLGYCPHCGLAIWDTDSDVCDECDGDIKYEGQCPECGANFFGEEPAVCPECGFDPNDEDYDFDDDDSEEDDE